MGYEIFDDLCKKKGIRPNAVSKATGISTATLTAWKQGKYTPKPDKLQKIANYFGVSLEYIMTGESSDGYYYNGETLQMAQTLYENPELHMLFSATKDATPSELKSFYDMVMIMKRKENHED